MTCMTHAVDTHDFDSQWYLPMIALQSSTSSGLPPWTILNCGFGFRPLPPIRCTMLIRRCVQDVVSSVLIFLLLILCLACLWRPRLWKGGMQGREGGHEHPQLVLTMVVVPLRCRGDELWPETLRGNCFLCLRYVFVHGSTITWDLLPYGTFYTWISCTLYC